jgi:DNA-binding CsgD family transcriptional regulator
VEPTGLRPIERRILRLVDEGVPEVEIAVRFRRSPDFVNRVIALAHLPGRAAPSDSSRFELRPIERCVLGWRSRGASHAEIAPRFHRSEGFVVQVEELAQYKLSLA